MAESVVSDNSLDFDGASLVERLNLPVVHALCATSTFSRLRDIAFLGAIDYAVSPSRNRSHLATRFDHSLGVAFIAMRAAQRMGLNASEVQLATVAGLLHDVGHGPLSHSLEGSFARTFGVDHHHRTDAIVAGSDRSTGADVARVLDQHGIDQGAVLAILNGRYVGMAGRLFDSPINVDTIEGIHRAAAYLSGHHLMQSPLLVANALSDALNNVESAASTLDSFWMLKHQIYSVFIRSRVGVLSDFVCQQYFDEHQSTFEAADFYLNDKQLAKRFKLLFVRLRSLRNSFIHNVGEGNYGRGISFQKRDFFVNEAAKLDSGPLSLAQRYRQSKLNKHLEFSESVESVEEDNYEIQGSVGKAAGI
jgi:uncharacterized protein